MDIKILTHHGIPCIFNMNTESTLKDLKIKINEFFGLSFSEQTLLFANQTMNEDFKKLRDYGIKDESCIKLIINLIREVFTFTVSMQTGRTFEIEVRSKDLLSEVKIKIERHCKLRPEEQILFYFGNILAGNEPISSYGIQDKSIVQIIPKIVSTMQIFGNIDGTKISLEMTKTDRIIDVKKKIQEKIGLSPDEQRLIYQGVTLEDDKTIDEYNIKEKSLINIVAKLKNGMQIFGKTMDGKTISFEVTNTERIIDVKKKIQEKIGLSPDEQKLIYHGVMLEDDKTIDECQIAEKSVINIVAKLKLGYHIWVKTINGETITIEGDKTARIIDVKKKIEEKIGLSPDEQKLVYQGGILEDDKTIDEYQIAEKSVINIFIKLRNGIQIFGKTMDGKSISIVVTKTDRIIDVKKKIQEKIGLSPDEQKLVYQGGILEDDKTIDEYQMTEKSVIHIVARLRNGIQIFGKTMDGKIIAFEVTKTDRIIDVKKKIQERIGLSPDDQKLVYQDRILEDDKTIDEYNIDEKSLFNISSPLASIIQIFVRIMDGKTIAIKVTKTDKIIDLQTKIREKIGMSPYSRSLIYNGVRLKDDKTVDEYQIVEKSVITCG